MARPYIIPFFITHQGCPHRCTFCNQHTITGRGAASTVLSPESARLEIIRHLKWPQKKKRQILVAFYGGSFTGLPKHYQKELLEVVQPFIEEGRIQGIRLSTRPDYISTEIVSFLK